MGGAIRFCLVTGAVEVGLWLGRGNMSAMYFAAVLFGLAYVLCGVYVYGRFRDELSPVEVEEEIISVLFGVFWPIGVLALAVARDPITGPREYPWTKKPEPTQVQIAPLPPVSVNTWGGPPTISLSPNGASALAAYAQAQAHYGWLTGQPRPKPEVDERDEPFYGWRSYSLNAEGYLQGVREQWMTAEKHAVCIEAVDLPTESQRREACLTHLTEDSCPDPNGCGIWATSKPGDGLILGRCVAWGVVMVDDEGNWRASDVRIEELVINKAEEHAREQRLARYLPYAFAAPAALEDHLSAYRSVDWHRLQLDLQLRYGVPVRVVEDASELR